MITIFRCASDLATGDRLVGLGVVRTLTVEGPDILSVVLADGFEFWADPNERFEVATHAVFDPTMSEEF